MCQIDDMRQIAKHYMQTYFFINLLACLPHQLLEQLFSGGPVHTIDGSALGRFVIGFLMLIAYGLCCLGAAFVRGFSLEASICPTRCCLREWRDSHFAATALDAVS
eukprot:1454970-Amphidinium_carterae.1